MPWRAAKHNASSCSALVTSGAPLSPAKLSPTTNSSTGCRDSSLDSLVATLDSLEATSSTLRSLSPYFRFRENDTCAQAFDPSGVALSGEGLEPSLTSPTFT